MEKTSCVLSVESPCSPPNCCDDKRLTWRPWAAAAARQRQRHMQCFQWRIYTRVSRLLTRVTGQRLDLEQQAQ